MYFENIDFCGDLVLWNQGVKIPIGRINYTPEYGYTLNGDQFDDEGLFYELLENKLIDIEVEDFNIIGFTDENLDSIIDRMVESATEEGTEEYDQLLTELYQIYEYKYIPYILNNTTYNNLKDLQKLEKIADKLNDPEDEFYIYLENNYMNLMSKYGL